MDLSTQYKGTITELQVATHLLSLGYCVSQPLIQDSKYDLIVDVNHKLLRLQVKTSRFVNNKCNSIKFNCRSTTNNVKECKQRRYSPDDIDFFATYWNDNAFLIPISECSTEKTIWLEEPPHNNCTYAFNYTAQEVLNHI